MTERNGSTPDTTGETQATSTPRLSGSTEANTARVDWVSVRLFGKSLAMISAAALGGTYLLQETMFNDDKTPGTNKPEITSVSKANKRPEQCRDVKGILRIVGVTADQIQAIHRQDDVAKIPYMQHQRDADGKKANVNSFEWRFDMNKAPEVNALEEAQFYTAAKYHFVPFTERGPHTLLGPDDVVIPDNTYNFGSDMVGQIVQYGEMKFCEEPSN